MQGSGYKLKTQSPGAHEHRLGSLLGPHTRNAAERMRETEIDRQAGRQTGKQTKSTHLPGNFLVILMQE